MPDLNTLAITIALWIAIICLVYHNNRLWLTVKRKDTSIKFWRTLAENYEQIIDKNDRRRDET